MYRYQHETDHERLGQLAASYCSDVRLLEAIEAVTGGRLDCEGACGVPVEHHPDLCADPAVQAWQAGDDALETRLRAWLDRHYPDWRRGGGLDWGEGRLDP